ncbi:laminin-like protein lam-2 [Lytechinus pictus]|uniref:laminin-like protein lam-2 n=1 Tax=Lytechinus pictus TaxID=7653 RepID=UPI0030B9B6B8
MGDTAEIVSESRRILDAIPSPQSLFSSFMKRGDENEGQNLKLKCSKDENEFTKLKLAYVEAETRSKMIEFILNKPMEEWPTIDTASDKENFDQVKMDLKDAKEELENLEDKLADMIDSAQGKVETMERRKKEAEDLLNTVETKKAKLESLKIQHEESLKGVDGMMMEGTDLATKLQKQRDALRTTELALQKCDLVLMDHKRAVSRLQEKCCMAKAVQKECQQAVETLLQHKAEHDKGTKENQEWLQQCLHTLKDLAGISKVTVADQSLIIDLSCKGPSSEVTVEVKMTFKTTPDGNEASKLCAAQLGGEIFDCSDVISEAISLNDPVLLIREVNRRLNSHAPVLQEVERLRHQYAIDYVHEERKLHAMLGSSGQVVCTLTIDNGYPTTGQATLTKIEGNGHHKDISDYKPPTEKPTMSDWLMYLQTQL